jgi:chemotaxis protein MotB
MAPEVETPPAPPPPRPIVIIKRVKKVAAGHHGGAWKVAYADFVTAMMALFIVLWLMSADKEVREEISAFFNNPSGPGKMKGTAAAGVGHAIEVPKDDMDKLRDKIQQALATVPNFRNIKDHVEITITADGLRIELLETDAGMFFESGRARPTEAGAGLLTRLAQELGKLPNNLLIEGHTDAKPFTSNDTYSNWELSTDRANAARRLMESNGIRPEQVGQVRGYAERQLRHPEDPNAASNRRISVIVQYLEAKPAEGAGEAKERPEPPKPEAGKAEAPAPAKEPPAGKNPQILSEPRK